MPLALFNTKRQSENLSAENGFNGSLGLFGPFGAPVPFAFHQAPAGTAVHSVSAAGDLFDFAAEVAHAPCKRMPV